jgi:hypothetical protein
MASVETFYVAQSPVRYQSSLSLENARRRNNPGFPGPSRANTFQYTGDLLVSLWPLVWSCPSMLFFQTNRFPRLERGSTSRIMTFRNCHRKPEMLRQESVGRPLRGVNQNHHRAGGFGIGIVPCPSAPHAGYELRRRGGGERVRRRRAIDAEEIFFDAVINKTLQVACHVPR